MTANVLSDQGAQEEIVQELEQLLQLARRGEIHQLFIATDAYECEPQYRVAMVMCCEYAHRCGLVARIQAGTDRLMLDTSDYPDVEAPKLNG